MVAKRKSVDSIVSPADVGSEMNMGEKPNTPETETEKPLLSIIEPEAVTHSYNKYADKKWYIWTREPKENSKVKIKKEKPENNKAKDKSNPFTILKKVKNPDNSESLDSLVQPKNDAKNGWQKKHKVIFALVVVFTVLCTLSALLGGAAYAHNAIYTNKVFPGVTVWGEEVGGKSVIEVQKLISKKAKEYSITLKGPDQDYKATVSDLGIVFNTDTMALAAFSRGRSDQWWDNYLTRARLLSTEIDWQPWQNLIRSNDLAIAPSYTLNKEKLNAYLTKISDNIKIEAQDSQVTVTGGVTQLKPAIYGRSVRFNELKQAVLASIAGLKTEKINVKTETLKPAIVDTAAEEVMVQAQNVMARPVVLTYKGTEYRPNQDTVGSWLSFTKKDGETKYTLVVDKSKMESYFYFLGSKINVYSKERIVRVENGVKQTEAQAGVNGLLVDTALLGSQIATALPSQASVRLEIPTYVDNFKTRYENVVIADWDKYIDINLSTQKMIACEKGGVNCREWSVTTGDDNHPTPTGTFLVLGRNASFYMTGGSVSDGSYYHLWVDHAVWFTSAGHAIHDAYWRNGSFGGQDYHWNGSHGCINSPDDAATYIFNWAPIGTPVIVHY